MFVSVLETGLLFQRPLRGQEAVRTRSLQSLFLANGKLTEWTLSLIPTRFL